MKIYTKTQRKIFLPFSRIYLVGPKYVLRVGNTEAREDTDKGLVKQGEAGSEKQQRNTGENGSEDEHRVHIFTVGAEKQLTRQTETNILFSLSKKENHLFCFSALVCLSLCLYVSIIKCCVKH